MVMLDKSWAHLSELGPSSLHTQDVVFSKLVTVPCSWFLITTASGQCPMEDDSRTNHCLAVLSQERLDRRAQPAFVFVMLGGGQRALKGIQHQAEFYGDIQTLNPGPSTMPFLWLKS